MGEAADDHSNPNKTVDDLFQRLIGRDIPPVVAKQQILEKLQVGKLLMDYKIAAGVRTRRPTRQATPGNCPPIRKTRTTQDILILNSSTK